MHDTLPLKRAYNLTSNLPSIQLYAKFNVLRIYSIIIIIDRGALAKQGDNALGSVRPSVRLGVPRAHYTPLQRFVCVSIIMGRILIIARMRSMGF